MRNAFPVMLAFALAAGTAVAQYKTAPPPQPGQAPGSVQVAPNPNIQMSMASGEDDLAAARRITRDEAIKLVKEKKAVYIDVRSKAQYDEGHIPGAISIPLTELIGRLREVPPRQFLITYCA